MAHRAEFRCPVEIPHHGRVAIEIETPFDIEHRGDLSRRVNSFDVGRIERDFNGAAVGPNLIDAGIDQTKRLFGFEAATARCRVVARL